MLTRICSRVQRLKCLLYKVSRLKLVAGDLNMTDLIGATVADGAASLSEKRSGSFKITQLAESVAICECVKGDRHRWNNATNTKPTFIVYLGCGKGEVKDWIEKLNNFYHCYWIEVLQPKLLLKFEAELKILGMKRCSDMDSLGLDFQVKSPTETLPESSRPKFSRVLEVNFENQTGESVTYRLPEGMELDSFIISMARSGQLEHLTYVSHHYQWIRHWCEAIDGEF